MVVEEDGDVVRREPIALAPGASDVFSETLALSDRAGPQTIHAALIGPDGTALAEDDLTLDGPPRLAPAARLIGLAASAGAPGGPVTLTATVDNDGPAGDAPLSFLAFDQTYEVTAALPAHGHARRRSDRHCAGRPAGRQLPGRGPPATHRDAQSSQAAKAEITLSGAQIDLTQALNAASYQPFSQATWTVTCTASAAGRPATTWSCATSPRATPQTVTLGAGQTRARAVELRRRPGQQPGDR